MSAKLTSHEQKKLSASDTVDPASPEKLTKGELATLEKYAADVQGMSELLKAWLDSSMNFQPELRRTGPKIAVLEAHMERKSFLEMPTCKGLQAELAKRLSEVEDGDQAKAYGNDDRTYQKEAKLLRTCGLLAISNLEKAENAYCSAHKQSLKQEVAKTKAQVTL